VGGIVVELMDGEGEDGSVFGEDGGGAVAVVDIGVDDHGAGDFFCGFAGCGWLQLRRGWRRSLRRGRGRRVEAAADVHR